MTTKTKNELELELAAVKAERDQLKNQVDGFVKNVLDYEAGCEDGKVAFLEYCGLEIPVTDDVYEVKLKIYVKGAHTPQNGTLKEAVECRLISALDDSFSASSFDWGDSYVYDIYGYEFKIDGLSYSVESFN